MASGFSFQNLSITKKIHAITCIAVVAFIIMVLINFLAIDDNRASLDEMGNSSYKVVKLTSANVGLLEKLDELYTQAVTFGEQDLITKADDTYKTIESNINLIKQMSNGYISNDVVKELADYEKISATIANGMVNGTADFSKIQQQAQLKTSLYGSVLESFKAAQQKADNRFFELVESTNTRSDNALTLMLVVSIVSLLLLLFMAIWIAKNIGSSASDAANNLSLLANGKGSLSTQLTVNSKDEIGQVSINFNAFIALLKETVLEVIAVCEPLMENSTRLVQGMEQAERATTKQTTDAEIVKQSMEEMKQSVGDISQSAANASHAAETAEKEVEQSRTQVQMSVNASRTLSDEINQAATTINKLADDTKNVSQILNVITSIADQTNLLALNAAIEAARAGEHGRGFAVVADEVRELASRTAHSTNEIRELLGALTTAANDSVTAMTSARDMATDNATAAEKTGISIEKIAEQMLEINGMNSQIAAATEEQTSVAAMVVENVSNMHVSFEDTMDSLLAVRDVAKNLHYLSDNLLDATAKFRIE
ncbi:chemotaxis protein [Pseudoalteromonas sp. 13-15]|jgi:methyl-accepting chemotaxis protein|uniref:methyl-accepting chemotaxis protein n=1 Tax=Pseudoalteromonas TaxID=53246 RepID=UPI0000EAC9C1|nr:MULTISPECIES: HAMP domain-containing methyl-accepting chemotaxis protein [Pseudoalteromonas]EAW26779.1 Methyl-accepting chemotaxis protein [Alteromonadales bacterium TW-7]MBL1383884.1 methyl-accepting chemotaxis protein [Colwellia sp.]ATG57617.1 methyl-accepting chemotaxis protein [Pseudoalteromonas marina]AUL73304.1 chemotaxis protein [Pseudoalteromonas sp. 13-15]MCK8121401.1 methyl-accepting chemotaxis protein [Pseudoalteromonas sp. 2CM32C]|tara:strand:- start:1502 stop:3127 length:1626 start_codon:yes stop_codon:yes gene_type:complete